MSGFVSLLSKCYIFHFDARYGSSPRLLFSSVCSLLPGPGGGALQATPLLGHLGEHCGNWDQVTPGPAGRELGGHCPLSPAPQPTPRPADRTGRGLARPPNRHKNHWETQRCAADCTPQPVLPFDLQLQPGGGATHAEAGPAGAAGELEKWNPVVGQNWDGSVLRMCYESQQPFSLQKGLRRNAWA